MEKHERRAKVAYELASAPEKFLATTLVGTNISVIVSSSLMTYILIGLGVGRSNVWITLLFTPLVVICAELIPKNIGRFYKDRFACSVAPTLRIFGKIFYPLVKNTEALTLLFLRFFVKKRRRRSPFVTKEEIKALVREIEKEGVLERGETEAIEDVFDFGHTSIKDVYLPIKTVTCFDYAESHEAVLHKARQKSFTRYPIFRNREVIGYLNIFDLFYQERTWRESVRKITKVGINQKLYDVFRLLRTKRESIALVYKGKRAVGIITLRDLIKEIIVSVAK